MAVYYFTISLLAGVGYISLKKDKNRSAVSLYLAASFLLLVFLASFRYAIGFDYFSYRYIYDWAGEWSFAQILQVYWTEPLYFLLCKISSLAGLSYPMFLVIVNIFLMACAMQFIYRFSKIPWVSVYLYVCLQFLAYNMNLIRQSIATAFFLLAFPFLKDRKLLPYTALFLAGGLFHNSLLFLFPLYFLLPIKLSRRTLTWLAALTAAAYLFFEPLFDLVKPLLPVKYANYQGSYFWHANGFCYVIFPFLYCLLIYLFRSRIQDPFLRNLCLNSALAQGIISLFITKHFILERFAVYPFAFSLIAIPEIISSYKEVRETTPIKDSIDSFFDKRRHGGKPALTYRRILILFLLFGMAYFLFAAANGFHNVYPYVSILDKSRTIP